MNANTRDRRSGRLRLTGRLCLPLFLLARIPALRFNPLMDDEYELDVWNGRFPPAEDARWGTASRGLRLAGASISHTHILNLADWREEISISGPVDLTSR